jgi:hypothetical protein
MLKKPNVKYAARRRRCDLAGARPGLERGRVCAEVRTPSAGRSARPIVETAQQARDDEQLPEHESFDGGDGL